MYDLCEYIFTELNLGERKKIKNLNYLQITFESVSLVIQTKKKNVALKAKFMSVSCLDSLLLSVKSTVVSCLPQCPETLRPSAIKL